jgi:hypothetical protein
MFKQNTCKNTELIINVFNNMYGIEIDREKYLKKTSEIANETISNMK